MIYSVDRERISKQTVCIKDCIQLLKDIQGEGCSSRISRYALTRGLHVSIEAVIDVCSTVIDGFIMRDPGSYVDMIKIMEDEKVISISLSKKLIEWVLLRDKLIRGYAEIDMDELYPFLEKEDVLTYFVESVEVYLQVATGG